ncbi:unnamed protein product [Arabidopsis lyrata]|nr:unnamed protein product [Arabidopsis lyrata]
MHHSVPVLDETSDLFRRFRQKKRDALFDSKKIEIYEEFDTVAYWKQKALNLEKMLEAIDEIRSTGLSRGIVEAVVRDTGGDRIFRLSEAAMENRRQTRIVG